MTTKLFSRDDWGKGLLELGKSVKVFVPVKDGDYTTFKPLGEGVVTDRGYQNTRMSPKAIVYPQSEKMFEFSLEEGNPEAGSSRRLSRTLARRQLWVSGLAMPMPFR